MGNTQTYKHRHIKHKQSNSKHSHSAYSPKKHHQRTRRHRHRHTRKQRGGGFFDFFRGKKTEPTAAVPASGDAAPAVAAPAVAAGVPGQGFLASIKGSATDVLGKGNDALVGLNESVATGVTGKISSIKDTVGEKAGIVSNLFGNSDAPPTGAPPTGETQAGGRRRKTNRKRSGHGRKHKKH